MTKVNELHQKWMKRKDYRKAHEELEPEFALSRAVIHARVTAGLTQDNSRSAWRPRNPHVAIYADFGARGYRNRNPSAHQFRGREYTFLTTEAGLPNGVRESFPAIR